MTTEKLSNKVTWLAASLALAAALTGCQPGAQGEQGQGASTESELSSQNGLSLVNGLSLTNGLSGISPTGTGRFTQNVPQIASRIDPIEKPIF